MDFLNIQECPTRNEIIKDDHKTKEIVFHLAISSKCIRQVLYISGAKLVTSNKSHSG